MHAVVLTIHLLLALGLIVAVLLQRSEGGGLGIGGGGGLMTSRGAATALSKLTWALGSAFVVTSLVLTIMAARDAGQGSVLDTVLPSSGAPASSAPNLGGGDLLPSLPAAPDPAAPPPAAPATPADGPAAPPPVQ